MEIKAILLLGPHSQHGVSSLTSNYEEPSTSEESTTTVSTVQIPKRDTTMMELLQSLVSQMDRMEATLSQFDSNNSAARCGCVALRGRPQSSSTTTLQVPITCHCCGEMGHSAIGCSYMPWPNANTVGKLAALIAMAIWVKYVAKDPMGLTIPTIQ